jgi:hypothetical protein
MPTPEMLAKCNKLIKQLVNAVHRDRVDHVRDCLARGADPNGIYEGRCVLRHALDARIDPYSLYPMLPPQRPAILQTLLNAGAKPDSIILSDADKRQLFWDTSYADVYWPLVRGSDAARKKQDELKAYEQKLKAYKQNQLTAQTAFRALHRAAPDLPLDLSRAIVLAAVGGSLVKPKKPVL